MIEGEGCPTFSIVTVVRNSASTIQKCIESVFGQTFKDFEYIIIDGNSTDGTSQIIEFYKDKIHKYIREDDEGLYFAMNKAIQMCNGMYIGILNADDAYLPNTLELVSKAFNSRTSVDVVYGSMKIEGIESGFWKGDHQELVSKMIPHPSCFLKRSVYREIGLFNTNFKISADYELMLRIQDRNYNFLGLDEVLVSFTPGGISSERWMQAAWEMMRIQSKYLKWNQITLIRKFLKYVLVTLSNRFISKMVAEIRKVNSSSGNFQTY